MKRQFLLGSGLVLALTGCPEQKSPLVTLAPSAQGQAVAVAAGPTGAHAVSPTHPDPSASPVRDSAQTSQAESLPALAAEVPCTLDTQLVPGIPGSPGHLIPSAINPNGNSELAQLMRAMQSELKRSRAAIERGDKLAPLWARFRKIRCAWPTNQSDRNPAFDASAQSYLEAVQALDAAPQAEAAKAYGRVLDGCRACHEQSCGGAIPAIEALRMTAPAKK